MFFILNKIREILDIQVLIPLDQGCFLFKRIHIMPAICDSLNPFGSGMFFIPIAQKENENGKRLNPFGSGMFFILPSLKKKEVILQS